ncbi:hypothetical protein ATANTOWER_015181, partial [Ataeniobius toweri]|nr:hypothetical protein [Ataeniobius toweri]
ISCTWLQRDRGSETTTVIVASPILQQGITFEENKRNTQQCLPIPSFFLGCHLWPPPTPSLSLSHTHTQRHTHKYTPGFFYFRRRVQFLLRRTKCKRDIVSGWFKYSVIKSK